MSFFLIFISFKFHDPLNPRQELLQLEEHVAGCSCRTGGVKDVEVSHHETWGPVCGRTVVLFCSFFWDMLIDHWKFEWTNSFNWYCSPRRITPTCGCQFGPSKKPWVFVNSLDLFSDDLVLTHSWTITISYLLYFSCWITINSPASLKLVGYPKGQRWKV